MVPVRAADPPAWPRQCLDLHQEAVRPTVVKRYSVAFDNRPSGYETFCVMTTDEEDVVFQWTSNAIHKFLGSTAIRHCRKEVWQKAKEKSPDPRRRLQLRDMQSWTNVASEGTHSLAVFLDQAPKPSSIRAVRRPDGSYRYVLMDLVSHEEKEGSPVQDAALRTPWTESMIPAPSVNWMDPIRYRISEGTKVVVDKPDPSIDVPHRRYRIAGPGFDFITVFRADDGALLEMSGKDAAAQVRIALAEESADDPTCPHPKRIDAEDMSY